MSALIRKPESQRIFASVTLKPLESLIALLIEFKDKELVVNGLSCINQAFENMEVLGLVTREFEGFVDKIEVIKAKHPKEDHISHECT